MSTIKEIDTPHWFSSIRRKAIRLRLGILTIGIVGFVFTAVLGNPISSLFLAYVILGLFGVVLYFFQKSAIGFLTTEIVMQLSLFPLLIYGVITIEEPQYTSLSIDNPILLGIILLANLAYVFSLTKLLKKHS